MIQIKSREKISLLNKKLQLYITCFNQRSFNNFLNNLMDKNQTTSLILNHFFGCNLSSRCSNKECYPTLDISFFKSLIWTRFCTLNLIQNIQNTVRDSNSQVWIHMGVLGLTFFHFFHNCMCAWLLKHYFNPLPFLCYNFGHKL